MKTENKKCLKTNNSIHRWLNLCQLCCFTLCVDLWKKSKRERGEESSLCWAKHLPHFFKEGSECRPWAKHLPHFFFQRRFWMSSYFAAVLSRPCVCSSCLPSRDRVCQWGRGKLWLNFAQLQWRWGSENGGQVLFFKYWLIKKCFLCTLNPCQTIKIQFIK